MKRHVQALALNLCLAAFPMAAQETGTASGKGTIDRSVSGKTAAAVDAGYEAVSFSPHFSWAYREGKGATAATWIVLTEKMKVDFYFLCPANGRVTSEGLNDANGLESIALSSRRETPSA